MIETNLAQAAPASHMRGALLRRAGQLPLCSAAQRWGVDTLAELLRLRLELMPWVAASKRAHGLPITDAAQEARVLASAAQDAQRHGLDAAGMRELFRVPIELAKTVQARAAVREPAFDLETELRPALECINARITAALAALVPLSAELLRGNLAQQLAPLLGAAELERLATALGALRRGDFVPARPVR